MDVSITTTEKQRTFVSPPVFRIPSDQDVDISAVRLLSAWKAFTSKERRGEWFDCDSPTEATHDFNEQLRVDSEGCTKESG